jgi:hypothetical protein
MASYNFNETDFLNATQINISQIEKIIKDAGLPLQSINFLQINPTQFIFQCVFPAPLDVDTELPVLNNIIATYTYIVYDNWFALILDKKTTGTNGGTFTAGSWITRTLNTIEGSQDFCSLSANQIILQPGDYHIYVTTSCCGVYNHQFRIYDITESKTMYVSNNGFTSGTNDTLECDFIVNLTEPKTFELQHQCTNTQLHYGFGRAVGFGEPEIYSRIHIVNIGYT